MGNCSGKNCSKCKISGMAFADNSMSSLQMDDDTIHKLNNQYMTTSINVEAYKRHSFTPYSQKNKDATFDPHRPIDKIHKSKGKAARSKQGYAPVSTVDSTPKKKPQTKKTKNKTKDVKVDVVVSTTPTPSDKSPSSETASELELDESTHSTRSSASSRSRGSRGSGRLKEGSMHRAGSIVGLDDMIEERKEEGDIISNIVHFEAPFGKPIEEVYDGVHTGDLLGSGITGLVRLITHRKTGVPYAVKCLDLGLLETDEALLQLREEIYIMCQLDHPNIVRLEEVYESPTEIYLVMELCLGKELFDRLDEQPDYHYSEEQCALLVKQMLSAVRYIHSKGIVHRDLKLENFLFSSEDPNSELKMIDFGLSKHFQFGEVHHEAVGTPYTVAPEVIRGSYDERCDLWAIGVITYLLLSGDSPFGGCGGPESMGTVRNNILQAKFSFEPEEIWNHVSNQGKEFIKSLLITDPLKRATAIQAQKSPWLNEWVERNQSGQNRQLSPNVVNALVGFKEYSAMRKLLCEVLSFTLLPDQIQDLRKEFEKLDHDGSGEITLTTLKNVLMANAGAGSLGALTEQEVEDIFNAMRVRKSDTTIHWHEFIAAGLSQCKVDDRNLRLAFDRLDSDHKGYIIIDDVMDLMGSCCHENGEDAIRFMYEESLTSIRCEFDHISYEDFVMLMKGQTRETPTPTIEKSSSHRSNASLHGALHSSNQSSLQPVAENDNVITSKDSSTDEDFLEDFVKSRSTRCDDWFINIAVDEDSQLLVDETGFPIQPFDDDCSGRRLVGKKAMDDVKTSEGTNYNPTFVFKSFSDTEAHHVSPISDIELCYSLPKYEHNDKPPRHESLEDDNMAPCLVNSTLYVTHRQMHLSVVEAGIKFEEKQSQRATRELLTMQKKGKAGLIMVHGQSKDIAEQVRHILEQRRLERNDVIEKGRKKSGRKTRGKARSKTVSDINEMVSPKSLSSCSSSKQHCNSDDDNNSSSIVGCHDEKRKHIKTKSLDNLNDMI